MRYLMLGLLFATVLILPACQQNVPHELVLANKYEQEALRRAKANHAAVVDACIAELKLGKNKELDLIMERELLKAAAGGNTVTIEQAQALMTLKEQKRLEIEGKLEQKRAEWRHDPNLDMALSLATMEGRWIDTAYEFSERIRMVLYEGANLLGLDPNPIDPLPNPRGPTVPTTEPAGDPDTDEE